MATLLLMRSRSTTRDHHRTSEGLGLLLQLPPADFRSAAFYIHLVALLRAVVLAACARCASLDRSRADRSFSVYAMCPRQKNVLVIVATLSPSLSKVRFWSTGDLNQ